MSITLLTDGDDTQDSLDSNMTQESGPKKQAATWNNLTLSPQA
jgi:hypothetical protein